MNRFSIPKKDWDERLFQLLSSYDIYAPVSNEFSCDYIKVDPETLPEIVYNKPKPVTPLKKFFLPVKENVTSESAPSKPVVVLGAPNCDVMALAFLDEIYLDEEYADPAYRRRRENTIIVSADCLSIQDHCHCTSYGIEPVGNESSDLSIICIEDQVVLTPFTKKGESFIESLGILVTQNPDQALLDGVEDIRSNVKSQLLEQNKALPDYETTGKFISESENGTWKKYCASCVSCGACSAICPTCSCFLLIDKPGFEKVRQLDTCQYPGFERVAGGEDALGPLQDRFRNRYMCKYVWKPEKYKLKACTGCGRCIETCIGQINKNELIVELSTS
jgi:ferredoxin